MVVLEKLMIKLYRNTVHTMYDIVFSAFLGLLDNKKHFTDCNNAKSHGAISVVCGAPYFY